MSEDFMSQWDDLTTRCIVHDCHKCGKYDYLETSCEVRDDTIGDIFLDAINCKKSRATTYSESEYIHCPMCTLGIIDDTYRESGMTYGEDDGGKEWYARHYSHKLWCAGCKYIISEWVTKHYLWKDTRKIFQKTKKYKERPRNLVRVYNEE